MVTYAKMSKINSYDKVAQDWEVVVMKKRPKPKDSGRSGGVGGVGGAGGAAPTGGMSKMKKLELSEDVKMAPRISIDLRLQIQKARCSKGLTQKQLAAAMNVPSIIIQNYENGKAAPTGTFLAKLERQLKCKFDRPAKGKGKGKGKGVMG